MEYERSTICDRCRRTVPFSDLRYNSKLDGSLLLLCSVCRGKNTTSVSNKIESKKDLPKKPVMLKEPILKKYTCSRCKYRFNFKENGISKVKCPYCGKDDKLAMDKVSKAQDIINSVKE